MCALCRDFAGNRVRAVHINHGLHSMADQWATHCQALCQELDVPLRVERVEVDRSDGSGLESAARNARYAVFRRIVESDEYIMTAHHQDDQLETVLLRILRGAGIRGLAGIPELSRFGPGWLVRPLLDVSRQALAEYAEAAGLCWIDDPSNADTSFDRNYLRHAIVPLLRNRWPGIGKTVGRAARLSGEAASVLELLAEADSRMVLRGGVADLNELRKLGPPRQRNVIRHHLKCRGLDLPSEIQMRTGLDQLLCARPDSRPVVRWGTAQIHRYRDRLYFLDFDPSAAASLPAQYQWDGRSAIDMGPIRGRLRLIEDRSGGVAIPAAAEGIVVRFRHGGERIREKNQRHHKSLKKLFQERGVVPWMRCHVPLLYGRDQLLAVGDFWIAADAVAAPGKPGYRIHWENHPLTQ